MKTFKRLLCLVLCFGLIFAMAACGGDEDAEQNDQQQNEENNNEELTEEEAWKELSNYPYDLVICMPSTDNSDFFASGKAIKQAYPNIPLVLLTPFSHGVRKRLEKEDVSAFDHIFCWLGNTDLLLSIIKLLEDKMNLEHDIEAAGVQMILFVEDSVRFYSSILPHLYKFVLQQSYNFSTEALNEHQRTLRMRGRPKIVLARTYEEAHDLYERFSDNMLGVITDVQYPRENTSGSAGK